LFSEYHILGFVLSRLAGRNFVGQVLKDPKLWGKLMKKKGIENELKSDEYDFKKLLSGRAPAELRLD